MIAVIGGVLALVGVHLIPTVMGWEQAATEDFLMGWALRVNGALPAEAPWRLITYGLVHFDALHLCGNLLGLALFGPVAARAFGFSGLLMLLWGSTALAGVAISLLGTPGVTLGISGGVMGLLGGVVVAALKGPGVSGTRTGGAVARAGVLLMALQSSVDALTPEISFVGHLSGGIAGAIIGALLVWASGGRDHPP